MMELFHMDWNLPLFILYSIFIIHNISMSLYDYYFFVIYLHFSIFDAQLFHK